MTSAQMKVNYKIFYSDNLNENGLKIELNLKLIQESDSTCFYYSDKDWDETNLMNCITKLKSNNSNYTFKLIPDSNQIIVYHPNSKNIRFSYNLIQDFEKENVNNVLRPKITNKYFHIFGSTLFIIPTSIIKTNEDDSKITASIEWIGFPANYMIHNSFASNKKKQNLKNVKLWDDFFYSVFVGGDYRIYSFLNKKQTIYFATRGEWFVFNDQILLDNVKKIVFSQKSFWNDRSKNYFTVIISPYFNVNDNLRDYLSISGQGLKNSFCIQCTNHLDNKIDPLKQTMYHEMLHFWMNGKIRMKNENLNYWFSEGFTDYYANKIRLQNGDLNIYQWLEWINIDVLKAHQNNPEKNQPNYVIQDRLWENQNFDKLPYRRGAIFAFYLDNQIMKHSNYKFSLDDVMREILIECETQKKKFTDELFLNIIEKYVGKDISYLFQKHIIVGIDFEFTNDDFITEFNINYIDSIPVLSLGKSNSTRYINLK